MYIFGGGGVLEGKEGGVKVGEVNDDIPIKLC